EVGHLFAAHWCMSEICNGGFHQFFSNSTGVLAPEALEGIQAMGLTAWADTLAEGMRVFGTPYPRDREERREMLMRERRGTDRSEWDPFRALDRQFFDWLHDEPDAWEIAGDAYAARVGAGARRRKK